MGKYATMAGSATQSGLGFWGRRMDRGQGGAPAKIVPGTANVDALRKDFTHTFRPYSVSVLVIQGR
jgi:hypothetical protein